MRRRFWVTSGFGLRDALVLLTLVSQLFATFGFPLFPQSRGPKIASSAYPCQNRPCGCLTADQGWQGDCCCFTLEEKLAWAEENGIEPPAHVRPLVESRRGHPSAPKKKSCCSDADHPPQPAVAATPTCCRPDAPGGAEQDAKCLHDMAKTSSGGRQKQMPDDDQSGGVRWVLGIFARGCRGEGPAGLFQFDPTIAPDLTSIQLGASDHIGHITLRSARATCLPHHPPTRPPRSR
jgi:hypothetical protein